MANRLYEFVELLRSYHQGRRGFQDHKIVAADLGENAFLAKHPHDDNLPEHGGMDFVECLIQCAECQILRWNEFDSVQETHATHFADHVEYRKLAAQLRSQRFTKMHRARAQLFVL